MARMPTWEEMQKNQGVPLEKSQLELRVEVLERRVRTLEKSMRMLLGGE